MNEMTHRYRWAVFISFLYISSLASPTEIKKEKKTGVKKGPNISEVDDVELRVAFEREHKIDWTLPALGVAVPTGFGSNWGFFYGGLAMADRTQYGRVVDGAAILGFGVGESQKYVGLESTITSSDLDPFARTLTFSFKLHKMIGTSMSAAVGVDELFYRGVGTDGERSFYGAFSKFVQFSENPWKPFSMVLFNVGAGQGNFAARDMGGRKLESIAPFASVGARMLPFFSLIAAYSSRDVDIGFGLAPFRSFRLNITPYVSKVFQNNGWPRLFGLSVVYSDSIFSETFPFSTTLTK